MRFILNLAVFCYVCTTTKKNLIVNCVHTLLFNCYYFYWESSKFTIFFLFAYAYFFSILHATFKETSLHSLFIYVFFFSKKCLFCFVKFFCDFFFSIRFFYESFHVAMISFSDSAPVYFNWEVSIFSKHWLRIERENVWVRVWISCE